MPRIPVRHPLRRFGRWVLTVVVAFAFTWMGLQKMFAGGPAELLLIAKSIDPPFSPEVFVKILGGFEAVVGVGLLLPFLRGFATFLLLVIAGMATSVFFLTPGTCFDMDVWHLRWVLSGAGHYLLMSVGLAAAGSIVAGRAAADP